MSRLLHALLVAAILTSLPGCALFRVGEIETRVIALEKTRDSLRTDIERDRKRLERLRGEAEESTTYLRQNGARISSRLDDIEERLQRTRGALEETAHRLDAVTGKTAADQAAIEQLRRRLDTLIADLRDRAGIAILALPRELPEQAEAWPPLAKRFFDEGEVRTADAVSRECRKRFVGTVIAGECGLLMARIAYEEHRFGDAIELYRGVHDGLGGKAVPVVARALLGISEVMEAEGKCKEAVQVLKYMRDLMKKGAEAEEARKRADDPKARCTEGKTRLPEPTWGSARPARAEPGGAAQPAEPGEPAGTGAPDAKATPSKTDASKTDASKTDAKAPAKPAADAAPKPAPKQP